MPPVTSSDDDSGSDPLAGFSDPEEHEKSDPNKKNKKKQGGENRPESPDLDDSLSVSPTDRHREVGEDGTDLEEAASLARDFKIGYLAKLSCSETQLNAQSRRGGGGSGGGKNRSSNDNISVGEGPVSPSELHKLALDTSGTPFAKQQGGETTTDDEGDDNDKEEDVQEVSGEDSSSDDDSSSVQGVSLSSSPVGHESDSQKKGQRRSLRSETPPGPPLARMARPQHQSFLCFLWHLKAQASRFFPEKRRLSPRTLSSLNISVKMVGSPKSSATEQDGGASGSTAVANRIASFLRASPSPEGVAFSNAGLLARMQSIIRLEVVEGAATALDREPKLVSRNSVRSVLEETTGLCLPPAFWNPWLKSEMRRAIAVVRQVDAQLVENIRRTVATHDGPATLRTVKKLLSPLFLRRPEMLRNMYVFWSLEHACKVHIFQPTRNASHHIAGGMNPLMCVYNVLNACSCFLVQLLPAAPC